MSVTSSTISPDRFDQFTALPREVQLLVWDFYEADCLKVRHVFSHNDWFDDFEYRDSDQKIWDQVWSTGANRKPQPGESAVIDSAVASRYEIPLPRHTRWPRRDPREVHPRLLPPHDFDPSDTGSFSQHTWMNFKLGSFCFNPINGPHEMIPSISRLLTGFFPCVKRDGSFMDPRTLKFNMSHWFWRIQHLELAFQNPHIPLEGIDKFALEMHSSLKSIILVVWKDCLFHCVEPTQLHRNLMFPKHRRNIVVSEDAETIISEARDTSPWSSDGKAKPEVVGKMFEFRREVRNLMKHNFASLRPVIQITVEGDYYPPSHRALLSGIY